MNKRLIWFFSRSGPTHLTATTSPNDSFEIPDSETADQQSERNHSGGKIKRISNLKSSDQQKANNDLSSVSAQAQNLVGMKNSKQPKEQSNLTSVVTQTDHVLTVSKNATIQTDVVISHASLARASEVSDWEQQTDVTDDRRSTEAQMETTNERQSTETERRKQKHSTSSVEESQNVRTEASLNVDSLMYDSFFSEIDSSQNLQTPKKSITNHSKSPKNLDEKSTSLSGSSNQSQNARSLLAGVNEKRMTPKSGLAPVESGTYPVESDDEFSDEADGEIGNKIFLSVSYSYVILSVVISKDNLK